LGPKKKTGGKFFLAFGSIFVYTLPKANFPPVFNLHANGFYFVSISTLGAVFSCFNNSCSKLLYAATVSPLPGTLPVAAGLAAATAGIALTFSQLLQRAFFPACSSPTRYSWPHFEHLKVITFSSFLSKVPS
jgi:hypothetical protein